MPDDIVTATPQIFGKLPTHGDFVARGVSAARRERLDAWLSASLAGARSRFGEGLGARYDTAQPWRFAHPDGAAWLGGALTPSVDAAGRRFPLYVAHPAATDALAAGAAAQCEDLVYAAFEGGWTVDRLYAALSDLTPGEDDVRRGWWCDSGGTVAQADDWPDEVMTLMLTRDDMA